MLPPKVKQKLDDELIAYEASPETWLLETAEGNRKRAAAFEFPEVRNPLARKALDSINRKVSGAREHFRRSYTNLIRDVRIFCGTNAVALLAAAWLLRVARTKTMRHWLGAWSVMLMVATGAGVLLYVNQDWWSSFIFSDYYGWSYLAINLGVAVYLFLRAQPTLWATRPKMD
ncbi:MAG: hypothetical protein EOP85_18475 [Verrucomicrobiaceae bacterium]|nr:MAG: hypothetical protein EOP85_18475 [Verrucomicrobiaceae bacterium]